MFSCGKEEFRDLLRQTKDSVFQGWTLRRIAAFFSDNVPWRLPTRNGQQKSIDASALSRLLSGQRYPGSDVIRELKGYLTDELPSRCGDNADDLLHFYVLPGISKE